MAVDLPMPIEPVRPRISIAASGNQHPMGAQEVEQRQQRQTQDREVVDLDRGEQLRPQPLELIGADDGADFVADRSEEQTSELQQILRISDAAFCLKKKHK